VDVVVLMSAVDYSGLKFPPSFQAAAKGDLDVLKEACKNEDVGVMIEGKSILHAAIESGKVEVIDFLVQKGAQIDLFDEEGHTPLHIACWYGKTDAVACLVGHKATINVQCKPHGMSPLHYAVCGESPSVVSILCENEADVNILDLRKRAPLHYVAMLGSPEMLRIFIKRRVNMEPPDENGKTPVDIVYDKEEFDMLVIMSNNGADISKFYNEEWNIKLRKRSKEADEEEESGDASSTDFYGFYPSLKRKKNDPQREIKKIHVKKWKQNIALTPDEIPKYRKIRIIKRIYKDRLPDELRPEFWRWSMQAISCFKCIFYVQ
jgi:ankyrin repeat protein